MCELFALSSRLPATVSLSLETLAEHGGGSAPHADGWGIAYYREDDARLIKDTSAAHDSDWVRFVQSRGLSSTTIISHIRKAIRRETEMLLCIERGLARQYELHDFLMWDGRFLPHPKNLSPTVREFLVTSTKSYSVYAGYMLDGEAESRLWVRTGPKRRP